MDIYSELNKAQAENLASDPTPGIKGRFYHKDTDAPLKVDDGTNLHTVVTDRNFESYLDAISPNYVASEPLADQFLTSGLTTEDVSGLSVDITTTGKPVEISLCNGTIAAINSTGASASGTLSIKRDGSSVMSCAIEANQTGGTSTEIQIPSGSFKFFEELAAGTYTYQVSVLAGTDSVIGVTEDTILVVREIKL